MDIYDKYPDLNNPEFVAYYDFENCYTRKNPGFPISEFDVAVAALVFQGNLSNMAGALRRSRGSLSGFISRNQMLADLIIEIEDTFLDAVEDLHKSAALKGDLGTQRFFLTTKGKERGYVTRHEGTGKNGGPLEIYKEIELVPVYPDPGHENDDEDVVNG